MIATLGSCEDTLKTAHIMRFVMKQKPTLDGIPETMLWTLHNRAVEALRPDGIIDDDKCIEIYSSIDYDFVKSFGKAEASHSVRSMDFDRETKAFLQQNPGATIVNLGEGLETQRYRIEDDYGLWLTVDLPDAMTIRERYIEPDDRHLHISLSALDRAWFDHVPKDKPVLIMAQGLLMYFEPNDVELFVRDISKNFKQFVLIFDTIPLWLSNKTLSTAGWNKTKYYTTPKMPWGINRSLIAPTLQEWLGGTGTVEDIGYSNFPRGLVRWFFGFFNAAPYLKTITPSIVKISVP